MAYDRCGSPSACQYQADPSQHSTWGLVDESALYEALTEGRISAAGLDVFEEQPPSVDNPLFGLDNFLAGMHVAGSTYEAMERTGHAVVDSVFAALGIKE